MKTLKLVEIFESQVSGYWGSELGSGDRDVLVVRNGDVLTTGAIRWSEVPLRAFSSKEADKAGLRQGDLVITTSGYCGQVAHVEGKPQQEACVSNFVRRLRVNADIADSRFIFHQMNTEAFRSSLAPFIRGTTMQNLSMKEALARVELVVPTLDEQRRIAAILDKADEVRSKRKAALETLETLSQAIFIEMFGDPVTNPLGWPTESLSVLTSKIGSGATPRGGDSEYKDHGIPLIRSLNIHDGRFLRRKLAFLDSEQAAKLDNVIVEENDVLLNITGASVARVCTVPNWVVPARVNQHVAIIRCEPVLSHCFLQAHLQSKSYKSLLLTMAESGATRQALTKGQIGSLKIMLPPRNLQASFESAIESATSNFDSTLKFTVSLSQLFASLQQRAFQGLL